MDTLNSLESRIDSAIAESDQARALTREHTGQRMAQIVRDTDKFNRAAAHVMAAIVRPRMELLARKFENASLIDVATTGGHTCSCAFGRTDRFPASTSLTFSVGSDERFESLILAYRLQILPVFLAFNGQDRASFPLDALDESAAATWVEERIGEFLKTYLQLEIARQYQQENMETDPVCGMAVNRNWAAAHMEFGGRMYYFCIEDCRRRFAEAPQQFVTTRV